MDFNLNEDQQAFADSARALFADYCSDDAAARPRQRREPFMRALWRSASPTGCTGC
jgi:alkylation response protein AidB-like acyl-CoA dehydrogenase